MLNLKNPESFNEKIQWLKLYFRKPIQTKLADKFEMREWVSKKIGSEFLPKIYGAFERPSEINFNNLPQSFVFKATHGSGWNIICENKSNLVIPDVVSMLNFWLKSNYYKLGREWCYRDINPIIICEEFLGHSLLDYKFFCFNGKVKYIQVDVDRFSKHTRIFFDFKWKVQNFTLLYPFYTGVIEKPNRFSDMIEIANILACDFPFIRVDLYLTNNKIYVGELTWYPENGFGKFIPSQYDLLLGKQLILPV